MVRSDPSKAIDLSVPNPNGVFALLGWFGPFPSRPCDECGDDNFRGMDWNLGYYCSNGHRFGTNEEWAWSKGQGHYGRKA